MIYTTNETDPGLHGVEYADDEHLTAKTQMIAEFGSGDIAIFRATTHGTPSIGLRDATEIREIGETWLQPAVYVAPILLCFRKRSSLEAFMTECQMLLTEWPEEAEENADAFI
jgi:hypothetical protein